jgi:hypothetical protein
MRSKNAAAVFEAYVEQAWIPTLRPGQVVIVDNLLPHKGEGGTHELLERWGLTFSICCPIRSISTQSRSWSLR